MTKLYSIAAICVLSLTIGCKSASKSYQKGNYADAIERGVKKLQKDPYDYDTRDLVQKSYNYSITEHQDQIRMLSNNKTDSRYEKIYQEYAAMQNLYETIHAYPAVSEVIKTKDYSEFVNTYREKAADVHIANANKWMEEGTKEAYREAYKEYNQAVVYRPEDFELVRTRDSVYDAALTKVIVSPIQSLANYQYGSSYQLQNFQRDVIRTLSYNMNNGFVKFYTDYDARTKDISADQIMEINFSRISIGQPLDVKTSREISKEVVVKETVYKPDSVIKQYATVKANITTTKRTLLSQGDLYITVRDTKGRIIWDDRFTGEHKWNTEFTSYTGDERALSDSDKTQLNQGSYTPPTDDKIMGELMQQIQTDLSSRLRSYYTRYN